MKRVCFSLALFLAASALRLKAQELEFTQVPADGTRLVIVTDPVKNPLLRFDLTNTTNIDQTYSLTHSGFLNVNNLSPGTSLANGTHLISARVPMESVSPGQHSVSMTATPVGGTPDSVSFDVFRVVNRPVTGTVDLDLGRVVRSSGNSIHSLGTLQLNSGSLSDAEATRLTTRSNTFDFNSTGVAWYETNNFAPSYRTAPTSAPGQGLRLFRSGSPVEFTDANQTVDYNIGFTSTGVKSVLLSGNDFHALFRPETLANSAVNTEGVSLEINATALNNRRFSVVTSGPAPLVPNNGISTSMGRVMQDASATHDFSGSQNLILHSVGSDTDATRVELSEGNVTNNGVTVTASSAHLFNSTGNKALTSDYSLTFDGTVAGRQTRNVSLADLLSSAEDAPLDHEEILAPTIGYHLDVVQKRQFSANGYTAKALVNNTISSIGGQVYSGGSDETTTRASIGSFQFTGPATYYDSFNIAGVSSPTAGGPTVIGTRSLSVTPEGLAGEGSYANVTSDFLMSQEFALAHLEDFQERVYSTRIPVSGWWKVS